MRVALKSAIFSPGKSQRRVAVEAGIPENRLSEIVCGWSDPRDSERSALMRVLGCHASVFERDSSEVRSIR